MSETVLYGIPNCDTVKKARRWLDDHGVTYRFHDLRKDGLDLPLLKSWLKHADWEGLLNRRSTTWRELPDAAKDHLDEKAALSLLVEHPTLLKRPVLSKSSMFLVGFTAEHYQTKLKK